MRKNNDLVNEFMNNYATKCNTVTKDLQVIEIINNMKDFYYNEHNVTMSNQDIINELKCQFNIAIDLTTLNNYKKFI